MIEIWKDIDGHKGIYKVSNTGCIKSLCRRMPSKDGLRTVYSEKDIKGRDRNGYKRVVLYKDGIRSQFSIHRLVADHFLISVADKNQINHINGIKTDNRADNLEWCTPSENQKHAYANNLIDRRYGVNHHNSIFTNNDVITMRVFYDIFRLTIMEISKYFNARHSTVSRIVRRETWTHI